MRTIHNNSVQSAVRLIERVGINVNNPDAAWPRAQEALHDAGFTLDVILEAKDYYFAQATAMRKEESKAWQRSEREGRKTYTREHLR